MQRKTLAIDLFLLYSMSFLIACESCDHNFKEDAYYAHLKDGHHKNLEEIQEIRSHPMVILCDDCPRRFAWKRSFQGIREM